MGAFLKFSSISSWSLPGGATGVGILAVVALVIRPSRCSNPWRARTRSSACSECPAARACRRATPRAITISPSTG